MSNGSSLATPGVPSPLMAGSTNHEWMIESGSTVFPLGSALRSWARTSATICSRVHCFAGFP
jgi:hypothetical protein